MDSRLEKYYHFIIMDMIKKTPIDYEEWSVDIPSYGVVLIQVLYYFRNSNDDSVEEDILDFIESTYGVTDKESNLIWWRYVETLLKIIESNG